MTIAVVAEKPAVARDIAKVLGVRRQGKGFLHGNGYVVTWAIGHLVTLAQPHEICPEWKHWCRRDLPLLPRTWPLVINEKTQDQFNVIRKIINAPTVEQVVCATDAGREGELIFRYIYEAAGCHKPVKRLWISSLTTDAIRQGFQNLRDRQEFDALAAAARGRSQADWLVGMNLSRACTLAFGCEQGEILSVGRVQTPTLAMVVERELAIRSFVPEDYLEVVATFTPIADCNDSVKEKVCYQGVWFRGERPEPKAKRLKADGQEANQIIERALKGHAHIASKQSQSRRLPPPLLYDLTELQRHGNRLYGFSAEKTLGLAQQLYEQRKVISYPRTDSRHLSQDVAATLDAIVRVIEPPYGNLVAPATGQHPLGRRFVDDSKVTDHHAIIPTPLQARGLSADEQKIYDLICRRLLAAWHDDHIWSITTVITTITVPSCRKGEQPLVDRYHSSGTMVEQVGWKILDVANVKPIITARTEKQEKIDQKTQDLPTGLREGQYQQVLDSKSLNKQTRPPPRFTEATLLTAMETSGRTLDDRELSDAMKETGLGTPATRAEIIETLLRRHYLVRKGKTLEAAGKGIQLIQSLQPQVKSPAMTGQWEAQLKHIQRGEGDLTAFMTGIESYVQDAVKQTLSADEQSIHSPTSVESLDKLLKTAFNLASFRPYQEIVCRSVVQGEDVLLVMPTGAGKSLCYQLPGLARAGTTLVISPLIALMEDQVAKLQEQGIRAERIHSGRDRMASRQVCKEYLNGRLDFLFIAPERLGVPGFPEMLARRKPVLIAVDEAHCISHWGHDFRPDYRLLGQRLPLLRPAPLIALTATATALVQDDIVQQLGIPDAARHIYGFRRSNIAVEVVELKPGDRHRLVREVLADSARRPAIVYAPTRKEADLLGGELRSEFPSAAYHAGMTASERDRAQNLFIAGQLQVIVATIAFGMGVDKPDIRTVIHTALPSTVEGYYQEIGRAGRDGKPARAILMYSYRDRRTHEFFHRRDYPEIDILKRVFAALNSQPQPKEVLRNGLNMEPSLFESALEKLCIHGGARIDSQGYVLSSEEAWQQTYRLQQDHKLFQLDQMLRYAEGHGCRMLGLIKHFGDREDGGEPCTICDWCAPQDCWVQRCRKPTSMETRIAMQILDALRQQDGQASGQIYRNKGDYTAANRRSFERILRGLASAGLIRLIESGFEKNGRAIRFWRAFLTESGHHAGADKIAHIPLLDIKL